eukprot:TRINITY_DN1560_c0_g1_i1.p1 TRINITY_DN1560_c0_g1~~TRINITY_DN1560_c0_g1_i1.p1  ORF type:complete len:3927 (-),score=676.17 TRINITY_DN1560_c0_g1_i1:104-10597(-)
MWYNQNCSMYANGLMPEYVAQGSVLYTSSPFTWNGVTFDTVFAGAGPGTYNYATFTLKSDNSSTNTGGFILTVEGRQSQETSPFRLGVTTLLMTVDTQGVTSTSVSLSTDCSRCWTSDSDFAPCLALSSRWDTYDPTTCNSTCDTTSASLTIQPGTDQYAYGNVGLPSLSPIPLKISFRPHVMDGFDEQDPSLPPVTTRMYYPVEPIWLAEPTPYPHTVTYGNVILSNITFTFAGWDWSLLSYRKQYEVRRRRSFTYDNADDIEENLSDDENSSQSSSSSFSLPSERGRSLHRPARENIDTMCDGLARWTWRGNLTGDVIGTTNGLPTYHPRLLITLTRAGFSHMFFLFEFADVGGHMSLKGYVEHQPACGTSYSNYGQVFVTLSFGVGSHPSISALYQVYAHDRCTDEFKLQGPDYIEGPWTLGPIYYNSVYQPQLTVKRNPNVTDDNPDAYYVTGVIDDYHFITSSGQGIWGPITFDSRYGLLSVEQAFLYTDDLLQVNAVLDLQYYTHPSGCNPFNGTGSLIIFNGGQPLRLQVVMFHLGECPSNATGVNPSTTAWRISADPAAAGAEGNTWDLGTVLISNIHIDMHGNFTADDYAGMPDEEMTYQWEGVITGSSSSPSVDATYTIHVKTGQPLTIQSNVRFHDPNNHISGQADMTYNRIGICNDNSTDTPSPGSGSGNGHVTLHDIGTDADVNVSVSIVHTICGGDMNSNGLWIISGAVSNIVRDGLVITPTTFSLEARPTLSAGGNTSRNATLEFVGTLTGQGSVFHLAGAQTTPLVFRFDSTRGFVSLQASFSYTENAYLSLVGSVDLQTNCGQPVPSNGSASFSLANVGLTTLDINPVFVTFDYCSRTVENAVVFTATGSTDSSWSVNSHLGVSPVSLSMHGANNLASSAPATLYTWSGDLPGTFGFLAAKTPAIVYWDSMVGLKNISGQFTYSNPRSSWIQFSTNFVLNNNVNCSLGTVAARSLFEGSGPITLKTNYKYVQEDIYASNAQFSYIECDPSSPSWRVRGSLPPSPVVSVVEVPLSSVTLDLATSWYVWFANPGFHYIDEYWSFEGSVSGSANLFHSTSTKLILPFNDRTGFQEPSAQFTYADSYLFVDVLIPFGSGDNCASHTTQSTLVNISNIATGAPLVLSGLSAVYKNCPGDSSQPPWTIYGSIMPSSVNITDLPITSPYLSLMGADPDAGYTSARYKWTGTITGSTTLFKVTCPVTSLVVFGGAASVGRQSLVVRLSYSSLDILGLKLKVDMDYVNSCVSPLTGSGTVQLPNLGDGTTLFSVIPRFYKCNTATGQIQWAITGQQITPLRIGEYLLSNATITMQGTATSTGTFWNGTITSVLTASGFNLVSTIRFDSVSGIGTIQGGLHLSTSYLTLDINLSYAPTSCTINTGTATFTINNVGPLSLSSTSAAVTHDTCNDLYTVKATISGGGWNRDDITFSSSVDVIITGTRTTAANVNNTKTGLEAYTWTGTFSAPIFYQTFGSTFNHTVVFSASSGFTYVLAKVRYVDPATGTILMDMIYDRPTQSVSCNGGGGSEPVLTGSGRFTPSLTNMNNNGVFFPISIMYSVCNRTWSITSNSSSSPFIVESATLRSPLLLRLSGRNISSNQYGWDASVTASIVFIADDAGIQAGNPIRAIAYFGRTYTNNAPTARIQFLPVVDDGLTLTTNLTYISTRKVYTGFGTLSLTGFTNYSIITLPVNYTFCVDPKADCIVSGYEYRTYLANQWVVDGIYSSAFSLWTGGFPSGCSFHFEKSVTYTYTLTFSSNFAYSYGYKPIAQAWSLHGFGVADFGFKNLVGNATLTGTNTQVTSFNLHYKTGISQIYWEADINILSPEQCNNTYFNTGTGYFTVDGVPGLPKLSLPTDFQGACNGTGIFIAKVPFLTNFDYTMEDKTFTMQSVQATITRPSTYAPLHIEFLGLLGWFPGCYASVSFDFPKNNLRVEFGYDYKYTAWLGVRSVGSLLSLTSGGRDTSRSAGLNIFPWLGGQFVNVFYDLMQNTFVNSFSVAVLPLNKTILAYGSVTWYGVRTEIFATATKQTIGGDWGFALAVGIDPTGPINGALPKSMAFIGKLQLGELYIAFSTKAMTFPLYTGFSITVPSANALTVLGSILFNDPLMQTFLGNINPESSLGTQMTATKSPTKIGQAGLFFAASVSADDIFLMVRLAGNIPLGGGVILQQVSLSIGIQLGGIIRFGFLAQALFTVGGANGGPEARTFVALVELYVINGGPVPSIGMTLALCSTPLELIPGSNVYMLFPAKFRLAVTTTPIPVPLQFGFAGGVRLGAETNNNRPAITGYSQVMIDLINPKMTSFYATISGLNFDNLMYYIAGVDIHTELFNLDSFFVNYNPFALQFSVIGTYNPNPINPLIATAESNACSNTQYLLNFNAPLPGIVVAVYNLYVLDRFISIDAANFTIVRGYGLSTQIIMRKFYPINGVSITSMTDENLGPVFEVITLYTVPPRLSVEISGKVSFFGIQFGARFYLTTTWMNGTALFNIGGIFTFQINFSIQPKRPQEGMLVTADFTASTSALASLVADIVNGLLGGIQSQIATAQAGLRTAENTFQNAINVLESAERTVASAISNAQSALDRARARVDSLQGDCDWYDDNCVWYKPWNCVAYGVCYVALQVARGALSVAQGAVSAAGSVANYAIRAASYTAQGALSVVYLAQGVLTGLNNYLTVAQNYIRSQMNSFGTLLIVRKASVSALVGKGGQQFTLTYDLTVAGINMAGSFQFGLTWTEVINFFRPLIQSAIANVLNRLSNIGRILRDTSLDENGYYLIPLAQICTQYQNISNMLVSPYSQVSASIPSCIFGRMPRLEYVNMDGTGLSGSLPDFTYTLFNDVSTSSRTQSTADILGTFYNASSMGSIPGITSIGGTIVTASILTSFSASYNNLTGTIPASFAQLASLTRLSLSANQLTDGLDNLLYNQQLEYLDMSYNRLTDSSSSLLLGDYVASFPSLKMYDFSGNMFIPSVQSQPLQPHDIMGISVALRLKFDSAIVCGNCAPSIQSSGSCHLQPCANAAYMTNLTATFLNYIKNMDPDQVHVPNFGNTINVIYFGRFCTSTTLAMFEYANPSADLSFVKGVLNGMSRDPAMASLVSFVRARTHCVPGRLGASCSYFCQLGWRLMASPSIMGTFLPSPVGGSGRSPNVTQSHSAAPASGDVYDSLLPFCMLPTSCGYNCTLAIKAALDTCLDYLDTFDPADLQACQFSKASLDVLCSSNLRQRCVDPIIVGIDQLLPKTYNASLYLDEKQLGLNGLVKIDFSLGVTSIVPVSDAENFDLGAFVTNLLLQLLQARAKGYNLFQTNVKSQIISTSNKRDGTVTVLTTISYTSVVNNTDAPSVIQQINNYTMTRVSKDSGLNTTVVRAAGQPPVSTTSTSLSSSSTESYSTSTTSTSSSSSSSSGGGSSPLEAPPATPSGLSGGAIAGVVIAVLVVVAAAGVGGFFLWRRRSSMRQKELFAVSSSASFSSPASPSGSEDKEAIEMETLPATEAKDD